MRPIVPDKRVKMGDPRSSRSGEIRHEAIGDGIFDCFLLRDNDVIFGMFVEQPVTFRDSRSNHSRDILAAHFVMDIGRRTHVMT